MSYTPTDAEIRELWGSLRDEHGFQWNAANRAACCYILTHYEPRTNEQRCSGAGWLDGIEIDPNPGCRINRINCPGCRNCKTKATPTSELQPHEVENIRRARARYENDKKRNEQTPTNDEPPLGSGIDPFVWRRKHGPTDTERLATVLDDIGLGEGFHTAFRKAIDEPEAMPIHRLISKMDGAAYVAVVDFVKWGITPTLLALLADVRREERELACARIEKLERLMRYDLSRLNRDQAWAENRDEMRAALTEAEVNDE